MARSCSPVSQAESSEAKKTAIEAMSPGWPMRPSGVWARRTFSKSDRLQILDATPLEEITPDKVRAWKRAYVNRAGHDELKRRRFTVSCNSYLRRARALFSETKVLAKLRSVKLPAVLCFDGVELEPRTADIYNLPPFNWLPQGFVKKFIITAVCLSATLAKGIATLDFEPCGALRKRSPAPFSGIPLIVTFPPA